MEIASTELKYLLWFVVCVYVPLFLHNSVHVCRDISMMKYFSLYKLYIYMCIFIHFYSFASTTIQLRYRHLDNLILFFLFLIHFFQIFYHLIVAFCFLLLTVCLHVPLKIGLHLIFIFSFVFIEL